MTVDEFDTLKDERPCTRCGCLGMELGHEPQNNGRFVLCPECGKRHAWLGVQWLSASTKVKREKLPDGNSVAEVWDRYGNRCISCTTSRIALQRIGIGLHRHHAIGYAKSGHEGLILPVCATCHELITGLQRHMARVTKTLQIGEEHDAVA